MHLEGIQKTVISPLLYCLFLGSLMGCYAWYFSIRKQNQGLNVHGNLLMSYYF